MSIGMSSRMTISDHFPVTFELSNLPDPAAPPAQVVPPLPQTVVLRNAATTNLAGPSGSGSSSHAVSDQSRSAQAPTQVFRLSAEAEFPGYYRLIAGNPWAGRYLGQEAGARDARMVLWPNEAMDQLWRPVYQGDGTWTLENHATQQVLTVLTSGGALAGRDFDGSTGQRWFLQAAGTAEQMNEVLLFGSANPPLAIEADLLETDPAPMILSPGPGSASSRSPGARPARTTAPTWSSTRSTSTRRRATRKSPWTTARSRSATSAPTTTATCGAARPTARAECSSATTPRLPTACSSTLPHRTTTSSP
ncbi:RICIN domain-containing protein [Nonomuraea sp. NPDC003804]|uniref:RICIN domain-containing protein n=1 Tax=Nonomuraea sp. NPDC003804 TaxID=3154547 RepID=UPI0033AD30B2